MYREKLNGTKNDFILQCIIISSPHLNVPHMHIMHTDMYGKSRDVKSRGLDIKSQKSKSALQIDLEPI